MKPKIEAMTYEDREKRLDAILEKLDSSEIPVDQLAEEAKEAASLIKLMHDTLHKAKQELTTVFDELEKIKEGTG
jgi:exodeoxyribonuclease VII small subunit